MQLVVVERDPLAQIWWRDLVSQRPDDLSFADDLFVAAAVIRSLAPRRGPCVVIADTEVIAEAGLSTWRRLCQLARQRHVELYVYSSSHRFRALAELLGREADGVLARPFDLDQLARRSWHVASRAPVLPRAQQATRRSTLRPASA